MTNPTPWQIFTCFLRLGAVGFGGPLALIALIDQECRERRKWVTAQQFNQAVLFCKLLPGPLAYQVALWMGRDLAGWRGGLAAALGFLLPGFSGIVLLAVFYKGLQNWSAFDGILVGVGGAALVVILASVWKLAEPYRHRWDAWALAIVGAVWMYTFPAWEPVSILSAGIGYVLFGRRASATLRAVEPTGLLLLLSLFWVHFKAGAFIYGTGVAVLPFLQGEVVNVHGWLTPKQFLDSIAFGQITPGPLTIAGAFIGFLTAGFPGAVVATLGMYLPGVILVLLVVPLLYTRLRGKRWLSDFQQGAMPVVIGGIAGAWAILVPAAIPNRVAVLQLFVLGAWMVRYPRFPAWGLMLLGAALGWVVQFGGGT